MSLTSCCLLFHFTTIYRLTRLGNAGKEWNIEQSCFEWSHLRCGHRLCLCSEFDMLRLFEFIDVVENPAAVFPEHRPRSHPAHIIECTFCQPNVITGSVNGEIGNSLFISVLLFMAQAPSGEAQWNNHLFNDSKAEFFNVLKLWLLRIFGWQSRMLQEVHTSSFCFCYLAAT